MASKKEKGIKDNDLKNNNASNGEVDSPEKTLYDAEVEYRKKTSRDSFTRLLFVSLIDYSCSIKTKVDSIPTIQQEETSKAMENDNCSIANKVCQQTNDVVTNASAQKNEVENTEKSMLVEDTEKSMLGCGEKNIKDDYNNNDVKIVNEHLLLSVLSKWITDEDVTSKRITGCLILSYKDASIFDSKSDEEMTEEHENYKTDGINDDECSLLGLLEGPPRVIYEILQKFCDSPIFHSTRVLLASEDCPQREFNHYGIFSINCNDGNSKKSHDLSVSLEEDSIATVDGILRSLCKEAKKFPYINNAQENDEDAMNKGCSIENLAGSNKDSKNGINCKITIERLKGKLRTSIPSYSKIVACAKSDFYCRVDEFLEIFSSPINVELASEKVHPFEPTIRYDDNLQKRLFDAYHNENI